MKNISKWRSCKKHPPKLYVRVEVKTQKGRRCIGYRSDGNVWLESLHHKEIEDPSVWRTLPTPNATWDGLDLSWMFPALKTKEGYLIDGEPS